MNSNRDCDRLCDHGHDVGVLGRRQLLSVCARVCGCDGERDPGSCGADGASGGLVGMVYAAGSVVWEVDRWSLAGQTAAYFLITLGSVLPVAYAAYWMERSVAGVLSYVAIFCAIFAESGFPSILDGAQNKSYK